MQIRVISAIAASLALLAPLSAYAQSSGFHGQVKLAAAVSQSTTIAVNGVDWRCDGDTCAAATDRAPGLDGFMRECRKVVAALGPVTAYSSQGRVMSAGNLVACNQAAKDGVQVASQGK